MARTSDRDRILLLLSNSEGLSNLRVRTELGLADERYQKARSSLLDEGLIEKYVCRGGGIRLTRKGERQVPRPEDVPKSTVAEEADLYEPLAGFLRRQADEDGIEAVICTTHALRVRGQWQNPDVARIAVERYPRLHSMRVVATTYEVKQFPKWDVAAVYEAASHHRFSHEAWVVLEWPNGVEFSLTDPTYKLDQIGRECQRFGVGLATLHPYYSSYRLRPRVDPMPQAPEDGDVEAWLDYVLSRNPDAERDFEERIGKRVPDPSSE
jgi:hypothetical protein